MITKSYTIQKDPYPLILDKKKSKRIMISSPDSPTLTIENFKNNSEPLNNNLKDLSFKGSPFISVSDALKKFGEIFGESATKHLKTKIADAAGHKNSGLKVENNIISFEHKSTGQKLLAIILYPIIKMPLDIANSTLKLLKKLPGLKKSKTIDKWLDSKTLKERRDFVKNTSDVAAIQHYFEIVSQKTEKKIDPKTKKMAEVSITDDTKNKKLFKSAHDRFKPLLSNYDTTTERTLTRVITGIIPAFFLANDAYNLTMYMKNDKHDAEKDKKRRFNQEVVRIGITAGFTFATMSLFAKKTNESAAFATLLSTGVVLVSETVGRLLAGTPVLPVGEKQARKYAKLQEKMYDDNDDKKDEHSDTFKRLEGQDKEYKKTPQKGNLTLKNVLKWMGILAVAGLGVDKFSNIKSVKKVLDNVNSQYKNLYEKEFNISKEAFNDLNTKLSANGFDKIAKKYESIIEKQISEKKSIEISKDGKIIKLGSINDKTKEILIHQILTFPVRFAWDTLMTPYKSILKPIINMATGYKTPEDAAKKEMEMLRNSIQFLQKNEGNKNYKEDINKSILSAFDNLTKSSYSNSNLASMTKIGTSGVASAFLIADNYNQVMIESGGKDTELAEQKAKERALQRGIRIAYGAFIIKLFNGVFAGPYNGSLMGAQAVNVLNTGIIESLERKSVGLPIGEATREEIIKEERANLNAKGLKGGYFRVMAKLTGKKSMSEAAIAKDKKDQTKLKA